MLKVTMFELVTGSDPKREYYDAGQERARMLAAVREYKTALRQEASRLCVSAGVARYRAGTIIEGKNVGGRVVSRNMLEDIAARKMRLDELEASCKNQTPLDVVRRMFNKAVSA